MFAGATMLLRLRLFLLVPVDSEKGSEILRAVRQPYGPDLLNRETGAFTSGRKACSDVSWKIGGHIVALLSINVKTIQRLRNHLHPLFPSRSALRQARRNSDDVVLDLYLAVRVVRTDRRGQLFQGRRAALTIHAVGVIHQNDVIRNVVIENRFEFGAKPVRVADLADPSAVARIQPPQATLIDLLQEPGNRCLAVALHHVHVRVLEKSLLRQTRETGVEFNRINLLKAACHRRNHFPVVSSSFDQRRKPELLCVFKDHPLLEQVRNSARLATQLPPPEIGVMSQLLEAGIDRQPLQQ
jgi:hypothetical protein